MLELVRERDESGESVRSIAQRLAAKYHAVRAETLRSMWRRQIDGVFIHEQRLFTDEEEKNIAGVIASRDCPLFLHLFPSFFLLSQRKHISLVDSITGRFCG